MRGEQSRHTLFARGWHTHFGSPFSSANLLVALAICFPSLSISELWGKTPAK